MGTSYSKSKKYSVYHIFVLHHLLEIIDAYVQLQNSIIYHVFIFKRLLP